MPSNSAIEWSHRLLTGVLVVVVLGYVAYQRFIDVAPQDSLYSTRQLSENTWLYVTKYRGGGATVSDVYRYYLDGKLDEAPLKHLAERAPFLVADVGDAQVSGQDDRIDVRVTGRVYAFSNSELFQSGDRTFMPVIDLTAYGVR